MASPSRCGDSSIGWRVASVRSDVEEPVEIEQVKAELGEAIQNAKRMVDQTAFLLRVSNKSHTGQANSLGDELVVGCVPAAKADLPAQG